LEGIEIIGREVPEHECEHSQDLGPEERQVIPGMEQVNHRIDNEQAHNTDNDELQVLLEDAGVIAREGPKAVHPVIERDAAEEAKAVAEVFGPFDDPQQEVGHADIDIETAAAHDNETPEFIQHIMDIHR
jgi:hypothetical protein